MLVKMRKRIYNKNDKGKTIISSKNIVRLVLTFSLIFILLIILSNLTSAYMDSNPAYTQYKGLTSGFLTGEYKPDRSACEAGQDFMIQIAPFGCTPAVVRTDLLEEQNVPVFCQLAATKLNPLIEVEAIDSISFRGKYPKEIQGIGFHPANSALGLKKKLNSPVLENIGYAVIVLKKQPNAKDIPDYVQGTMTAEIRYDIKNAFGIGKTTFYLPVIEDSEWEDRKAQYSFWDGKGYLRAESVDTDEARISVYDDMKRIASVKLKKGETSDDIFLPKMSDCLATLDLRLEGLEYPGTRAKLNINGEVVEVSDEERFLNDECRVTNIDKKGLVKEVSIICDIDDIETGKAKADKFTLKANPKIRFKDDENNYQIGDKLNIPEKNLYLGFIGTKKNSGEEEDLYALVVEMPLNKIFDDKIISSIVSYDKRCITINNEEISKKDGCKDDAWVVKDTIQGKNIILLEYNKPSTISNSNVLLQGFSEPSNSKQSGNAEKYYNLAMADFETVTDNYPSEKYPIDETSVLAEEAYLEAIFLSSSMNQKLKTKELCEEFKKKYPGVYEEWGLDRQFCDDVKLSDTETPSHSVTINGKTRVISLEGIVEPSEKEYSATISVSGPSGTPNSYSLGKLETRSLVDVGGSDNSLIQLTELKDDSAEIKVIVKTTQKIEEFTLDIGKSRTVDKYTVTFNGIIPPFANPTINVKGQNKEQIYDISKGKLISLDDVGGSSNEKIEITNINPGDSQKPTATIKITYNKESSSDSKTLPLKKDVIESFGGYTFTLTEINLKRMAKVSVNPNIKNAETEANFTFKIAIEQRAIKLSPEQTKEKIENLNKSLKDWESKTEKLGNVVQGMKTACLATGTYLTVKNFFANTGGKAIARQDVMDGWREKCQGLISGGKYKNYEQCYTDKDNAEQIEKDVENLQKIQGESDNDFKKLQEGCTEKSPVHLFGETIINDECVKNKLFDSSGQIKDIDKNKLDESIKKCFPNDVEIKKGETQKIEDITKLITKDNSQVTSVRDLFLLADACNNDNLRSLFSEELKTKLTDVWVNKQGEQEVKNFADKTGFEEAHVLSFDERQNKITFSKDVEWSRISEKYELSSGDSISGHVQNYKNPVSGGEYILVLDKDNVVTKTYKITGTKNVNGKLINTLGVYAGEDIDLKNKGSGNNPLKLIFEKLDSSSYQNPFKSVAGENEIVIKLYDTEPYKGYPALVPFDQENGWYAAILPILGNIKSYESSGRVHNFYLCNVGSDGIAEFFSGINEDKCQMINPGIKINTFSGLNQEKSEELAGCAISAIEQVSRVSVQGKVKTGGSITINTGSKCGGSWKLKIGAPAVEVPVMQCQDFMSVKDCQIMYNVCDPVICPSSRCDLGGAYPVTNVIQQGIIGGIALCLPNFNPDPMKGVVVPLCLSGIHAGLEGWVSILKNHRDCLQESLDSGKMIGVCDEIYSIYKCEFFWRQGLPLAKMAIPKLLEKIYGQGTKGGGEYLGIQSAWDNAGKSVDYFTQYYGANSFEAFKSRTVEEIGEEACRLSVSASYPDGGNILDKLTEPDSPPQFHGRFDETPFSDVTVPPISHYKVFYHIYAGKSSRAYYQVYLKGSPESTYYQDTKERLVVASGYIATGGYASETKDFTATSGYKKMCIVVNGQEECEFKEVSTSFAVNYVKDKYMEEQASQRNIKTETECIAGSRSAYALINPSMQGAAEELASPSLYNRGITRICATDNPGKGTDSNANANGSRWVDVGYCDNTNMKCWLDTNTVSDVIKNLDIEAETLEKMNKQNLDILKQSGKNLSDEEIEQKINEIKDLQKQGNYQNAITKATETLEKTLWNNQKAKLYLERGIAYGELSKEAYDGRKKTEPTNDAGINSVAAGSNADSSANGGQTSSGSEVSKGETEKSSLSEENFVLGIGKEKRIGEYSITLDIIRKPWVGDKKVQITIKSVVTEKEEQYTIIEGDFISLENENGKMTLKLLKVTSLEQVKFSWKRNIQPNDCFSNAHWVDKSFTAINVDKDISPGKVYIKLEIKSLRECWGYYAKILDNKEASSMIFIDGTDTKLTKKGDYYYLPYEVNIIKKGFMNYDINKYRFEIYDSNQKEIFESETITVDTFYAS